MGCGCRGRLLATELRARGHAVRGTTRTPDSLPRLEAAGIEAWLADPDRVATLAPALDHVSAVCVLLGSARGLPEGIAALHTTRLEMLLTKMIDSTARGIVYECAGSVDRALLRGGAERVRTASARSEIGYALLDSPPEPYEAWAAAAAEAVELVLDE